MTALDLNEAKYKAMEAAHSEAEARLIHDAGNVAMAILANDIGRGEKWARRFRPTIN